MTNEEAIKRLKEARNTIQPFLYVDEAIDYAIKALEQQLCEDCISRQAVKEMLNEEWNKYMPMELDINLSFVMEKINELPSVTPKARWIPVSERLPDKSGEYWCTFHGTNLTGKDYYTTESDAKKLFDDSEEYTGWRSQNVIAWMPLPEPYKTESEE